VTALHVSVPGPPRHVFASDGHEHVEYDLVITNAFTAPATLESLTVTGAGRRLLRLSHAELGAATHEIIADAASGRIPASATAMAVVDITLPAAAGRSWPRRVVNRIDYTLPADASLRAAIGSTTVFGPALATSRRSPIVIASPLRGPGWLAANACCDASSVHRNLLLADNGSYVTPEMFAVDWAQVHGISFFTGDGLRLTDFPFFGASIHAVANGTVVSTINNRPEVPPFASASGNPTVQKPLDFGGNQVIEKLGPGLYAAYEHLQTGSVLVHRGQHLHTGQVIARLGNTGNTTFPHLHFGIQDGPNLLTSNALPFEIDHYTQEGTLAPDSTLTHLHIFAAPRSERRSYPLLNSIAEFPGK